MTTDTLTLSAFLLARIAEDERDRHSIHEIDCDLIAQGKPDPTWGWECDCPRPDQIKAECAAKRRIVELHHPHEDGLDVCQCEYDPTYNFRKEDQGPCPTLRALASVYADHPDFREEWRA